jgi:hypothetical protein
MPAAELAVVGIGVTAAGPGLDVVALAALCRHVAAIVGAAPIEDFKGPANGSGEPTDPSEVDDPHGPSNTTPFDQRLVHQRRHGARGDGNTIGELADPAPEGLVTH